MHFPEFNITRRSLLGGVALAAVAAALPFALTPGVALAQDLPQSSGDVDMAAVMKPGPLPDRGLGDVTAPV
jgi:hypothetical protein